MFFLFAPLGSRRNESISLQGWFSFEVWHAILKVKHMWDLLKFLIFQLSRVPPSPQPCYHQKVQIPCVPWWAVPLSYMPRTCTCSACPVERADELNFHQEKEAHCAYRGSWVFVGTVDKNISNFHIIREKMHAAACTQASSLSEFVVKFPLESKKNPPPSFPRVKAE